MIRDHMNIWLLRPGVGGFGDLPTLTDRRELGVQVLRGDSNSKLWNGNQSFELLGAIWLRAANELVMIFEDGLVAIVQSNRSFAVSRISFEVTWIELPDNSTARVMAGGS